MVPLGRLGGHAPQRYPPNRIGLVTLNANNSWWDTINVDVRESIGINGHPF